MELDRLEKLLITPDFDGLPNLERFSLHCCPCLKKLHPSIGRLQKLVFLSIERCRSLKRFPPIAQLKKLETLSFSLCAELFRLLEIQQQKMGSLPRLYLDNSGKKVASDKKSSTNFFFTCWMGDREVTKPREDLTDEEECTCLPHNNMNRHTQLRFLPTCLRKLDLSRCNVGDNIGFAVWDLPNLEELIVAQNRFTRLNFSVLRLPRLKMLNVKHCKDLVELSELPSSIAIVLADDCSSLESFGDISNCKWLWKVSILGNNKLGPHGGDILLHSMLQGNVLEDHFISFQLQHQMILKGFVRYRGKTFTLHLPDNWYNDFCGFLICVVTERIYSINIVIKQKHNEDSPTELWQESNEAMKYVASNETMKYVGYVSFSSLRRLNSSYNMILFSIEPMYSRGPCDGDICVGVELIPRKSKVDEVQATNCSEFWDKESKHGTTFTIEHDSQSSIKILWKPDYYSTIYCS